MSSFIKRATALSAAVVLASGCKYDFSSAFDSGSAVSYTGQTKRHVLIEDLVDEILALPARPVAGSVNVASQLNFYFDYDGGTSDGLAHSFAIDGESLLQDGTYGGISTGKNLSGKIAGNDPALINGEFFGWELGMDADPTPEELVDYFFAEVDTEAKSAAINLVTAGGPASITTPYLSPEGHDYRQLIQKFLLGAVAFSQGTGDYLVTDFRATNVQEEGKGYTEGGHNWDEGFGYFGAARNFPDYSDEEIANKGGRPEFAGYNDRNGDGVIDLMGEYNFGHSTNCAKRDLGTAGNTNPTDFTTDVFNAFFYGRFALNAAANIGTMGNTEVVLIDAMAKQASVVWEKCISSTVVHYINDVIGDMNNFSNGQFADEANFTDLAKHWAEMKGFALGLQFNPRSPFRTGDVQGINLNDLKTALALMGDSPVLPDGTQNGVAFAGGTQQYVTDLLAARDILEQAYEFDPENVANW
jgi:hypothetical protein